MSGIQIQNGVLPVNQTSESPAPGSTPSGEWLLKLVTPLARPWVAGLVALAIYLLRASLSRGVGLGPTHAPFLNYLADAFLHGQLYLRQTPGNIIDLVNYQGRLYLYWSPFPALLIMPLVALFGVEVSDVLYTVALGAATVALVATLLLALDRSGVAMLSVERRAIVVATTAFGSVLLILAPSAGVWHTAQIVGVCCVLLASIAALTVRGVAAYFLAGLALAGAMATRAGLLFNGIWLAYYLLSRDRDVAPRRRVFNIVLGLAPVAAGVLLLAWYNAARFGQPLETGLNWQIMPSWTRADFERYGQFNPHYVPRNFYYQFVAYTLFSPERWRGGGLFWMTPIYLGALFAAWHERHSPLVRALALSCVVSYVPVALYMSPGGLTFGPRYVLDLFVPLLVLTARGIRNWRLDLLLVLFIISVATYGLGSWLWWLTVYW